MKLLFSLVAIFGLQACIITSGDDDPNAFCGDGFRDPGEECDDGNSVSGDGCTACTIDATPALLTANWSLRNVATNSATSCPTGFPTAAIYSQPVNSSNQPVGQPVIDLFDCAAMTGVTAPLDPGVYQVWVAITNDAGTQTYAQSLSAIVDLTDSDKTFTAAILNDGGYFSLTWDLVDAANGNAPLTCSQVTGLDGVGVVSTSVANQNNFFDDKFTCDNHYGVTGGLLAGAYTVAVDAFEDGQGSIGGPVVLSGNRTILDTNRVTDLGNVIIPIN